MSLPSRSVNAVQTDIFKSEWPNYGGQIDYVNNLLGNGHSQSEFYTNPTVVNAFKNYVSEIVTRYKDSPAVFAWELANEVRYRQRRPSLVYPSLTSL